MSRPVISLVPRRQSYTRYGPCANQDPNNCPPTECKPRKGYTNWAGTPVGPTCVKANRNPVTRRSVRIPYGSDAKEVDGLVRSFAANQGIAPERVKFQIRTKSGRVNAAGKPTYTTKKIQISDVLAAVASGAPVSAVVTSTAATGGESKLERQLTAPSLSSQPATSSSSSSTDVALYTGGGGEGGQMDLGDRTGYDWGYGDYEQYEQPREYETGYYQSRGRSPRSSGYGSRGYGSSRGYSSPRRTQSRYGY